MPKVNWAAPLIPKFVVFNLAMIPALSKVATAPALVKLDRAVVTRNRSLLAFALKSVMTSKLAKRESVRML